jgi:hypothetical protein
MLFKHHQPSTTLHEQHGHAFGSDDADHSQGDTGGGVERSVFCQHGLHHGHFPVAGLTVGEARQTLTQLLNIDPESVAVINGELVPDDYRIGEQVAMLNFVKKSSVKG